MPLPVSLDEVVGQLEMLGDETSVFVNRKTGDIETVFLPDLSIVEEGREEQDKLEWGEESLPVLLSIAETEDWFCLPGKFEIHEWEVMRRFAESRPSNLAAELRDAVHGGGAFRKFKDIIYRRGVEEDWFAFKLEALRRKAAEALENEGIPTR